VLVQPPVTLFGWLVVSKNGALLSPQTPGLTLRMILTCVSSYPQKLRKSYLTYDLTLQFSSSTVGLWASTDSAPLTKVVQNIAASTSTNSADWHLGVLRIVTNQTPEDWYFSGVYVENGPVTTSVGSGDTTTTSAPTINPTTSSTLTSSTSTSASGPTQTQWGQCGGAYLKQSLNF